MKFTGIFFLHCLIAPNLGAVLDVHLKGAKVTAPNQMFCTLYKLDFDIGYITEITHNLTRNVHHTVLLGRTYDELPILVKAMKDLNSAFPCNEGFEKLIYGTSDGAEVNTNSQFKLPEDTGIPIGKKVGIEYLMMSAHYKAPMADLDHSGFILKYTLDHIPRIMKTHEFRHEGGTIPALATVNADFYCTWPHDQTIYPVKFNVHTHNLGVVTSGYVVSPKNEWALVGKQDTSIRGQTPHDVQTPNLEINKGDRLAMRCVFENTRDTKVDFGADGEKEEMCDYYLSYAIDNNGSSPPEWFDSYCELADRETHEWKEFFDNIPEVEANTINGVYFEPNGLLKREKESYWTLPFTDGILVATMG